jgi:hypothetical protein
MTDAIKLTLDGREVGAQPGETNWRRAGLSPERQSWP